MKNKKYFQEKCNMSNLFVDLIDEYKIIDEELFDNLKNLQEIMFNNIKNGLLGRSICKVPTEITEQLQKLINELIFKTEDFKNYISVYSQKDTPLKNSQTSIV